MRDRLSENENGCTLERELMTTKDFFHFWNNISRREHRLGLANNRLLCFIAKRTHVADVRHLGVDCSCSICKETKNA